MGVVALELGPEFDTHVDPETQKYFYISIVFVCKVIKAYTGIVF